VENLTVPISNVRASAFEYFNDSFTLKTKVGKRFYCWRDIKRITAYKADPVTYDDLRIDIEFENLVLTLSKDLAGWSEFVEMLPKKLPGILLDWKAKSFLRHLQSIQL